MRSPAPPAHLRQRRSARARRNHASRENDTSRESDDDTRSRLLDAAAEIIAERGFALCTVRDICRRARANVASVNYHFGSKESLHVETLRRAVASAPGDAWYSDAVRGAKRPTLRAVVRGLAQRILGGGGDLHARLMMRAMLEPNPALDAVVREFVEPRVRILETVLAKSLPTATPRRLRMTALSIVGQIVYYRLAAPVALRLLYEREYPRGFVDEVAEHVTAFTKQALRSARRTARRNARGTTERNGSRA